MESIVTLANALVVSLP